MTKASRQHLRSRLRNYQTTTTTWNPQTTSSSASTVSVVDLLTKLRLEQGRAERNRLNIQVSKIDTSESFRPYEYIREHIVNPIPPISQDEAQREAERMRALELIPGPPPPESWRTLHGKEKSKLETEYKEKWLLHHSGRQGGVESLADICARVVSRHLESFYALRQDDELYDFTTIPFQTKERILYWAALEQPISDKILPMFVDDNYEDLCFENATISFAKFVRTFWKIVRRRPRQIVETWEELAPEDGSDDNSDYGCDSSTDKVETSVALDDINLTIYENHGDDEQDLTFPPYLVSIFSLAPTVTLSTHFIQTQLATTLRHLNLSFTSFPAVPLAHLIVTTLPRLTRLSLAGCFERRDGPHGLSILSRGLSYLEHLDLSYCDWLVPDILVGQSSFVNWARDWRALRLLVVRATGKTLGLLPPDDLPSRLTHWLDSVRGAACKVTVVAD